MDFQSLFVDAGISTLLMLQVLKLINGWLKSNERSKLLERIGSAVGTGVELAQGAADIGHTIIDVFSDGQISKDELDQGIALVKRIRERSEPKDS